MKEYIICFILLCIASLIYYLKTKKLENIMAFIGCLVTNLAFFLYNIFIKEVLNKRGLIRVLIISYVIAFLVTINYKKYDIKK